MTKAASCVPAVIAFFLAAQERTTRRGTGERTWSGTLLREDCV